MSWIDDGEQAYRKKRASQEAVKDVEKHKAEVIGAKARPYLDQLVEVVARDVADYSKRFENDAERRIQFTKKPSGGFKLDKDRYPVAGIECSLEGDKIKALFSHKSDERSPVKADPKYLLLDVDDGDNITARRPEGGSFASLDDVSRYLIERVLFV